MIPGLTTAISNLLGIVSGWIGLQSKKLDLKNEENVQAAAQQQDEAAAVDKTNKAIAAQDLPELRKELSE